MKTNKKFENLVRANVNKGVAKKEDKKTGVIQTIINILSNKAHTKDSLLKELKSYFPERDETSLQSTLKAQFAGKNGTRIEKERGIELVYMNKKIAGETFVHFKIKGFKDWSEEENEDEE